VAGVPESAVIGGKRVRLIGLFIVSDVIAIAFSYFWSYLFRFYAYIIPVDPAKGIPPISSYIAVFPLFLAAHLAIFYFQGFYKTRLKRTKIDDFLLICLNGFLTVLFVLAVLSYLSTYSQGKAPLFRVTFKISHGFLVAYFVAFIFMVSILRNQIYYFMKRRFARGMNLQNVLIIGAGEMGRTLAQKLRQFKDLGFLVKGFLDDDRPAGEKIEVNGGLEILGNLKDLEAVVTRHDISDVYVALDLNNYAKILECLRIVNKYVVNVRLIPDLFQLLTLKANIQDLDGIPVISVDEVSLRGMKSVVKRTMDVAVSALGLLILSPLLLVVAVIIKLFSKGPVFYHQERVGLDGRKFTITKYRTMVCDAEKDTGPVMCRPDDPRMTVIGRLLRKYSIDELPQLVNVLRGEMSLIGPRPERPSFVRDFAEKIPKYMLRHKVKSGITGWAQVHGLRQETPIDKRLEYDFYYIQNWSLSLDLKIIWMTLRKGFIDRNL
jgi:exopolysaccharide biosynthesis polyprenyl glycosylphosphotransferase